MLVSNDENGRNPNREKKAAFPQKERKDSLDCLFNSNTPDNRTHTRNRRSHHIRHIQNKDQLRVNRTVLME